MFLPTGLREPYEEVPEPPPDPPMDPVDIGDVWVLLGDSQTDGRDTSTTKSHAHAFGKLAEQNTEEGFPANPYTGQPTNPLRNGGSGRTLAGTRAYYDGLSLAFRQSITMIWIQESGNQLTDGTQDTVAEYKALVKAFAIAVRAAAPTAVIVWETSYSFGREGEAGRNWTLWNAALLEAIAELLAEEGITVYLVDTDAIIKRLQTATSPGNVWFQQNEPNSYHYKGPGNLAIALGGWHALGRDINAMSLAGFDHISAGNKTAILAAVPG